MDQIFETTIAYVNSSPSSIFTKDDVVVMLLKLSNSLSEYKSEQPQQPTGRPNILAGDFAEFTSTVREKLSYYLESSDLVDYDSAEFEFEYDNRIVLRHVHVDLDSWTEDFDEYMLDTFAEVFGDDSIIAQQ
jgi:hypothetical protein